LEKREEGKRRTREASLVRLTTTTVNGRKDPLKQQQLKQARVKTQVDECDAQAAAIFSCEAGRFVSKPVFLSCIILLRAFAGFAAAVTVSKCFAGVTAFSF
jgi:hypothetical protein